MVEISFQVRWLFCCAKPQLVCLQWLLYKWDSNQILYIYIFYFVLNHKMKIHQTGTPTSNSRNCIKSNHISTKLCLTFHNEHDLLTLPIKGLGDPSNTFLHQGAPVLEWTTFTQTLGLAWIGLKTIYWLVHRDPFNGLSESQNNWEV